MSKIQIDDDDCVIIPNPKKTREIIILDDSQDIPAPKAVFTDSSKEMSVPETKSPVQTPMVQSPILMKDPSMGESNWSEDGHTRLDVGLHKVDRCISFKGVFEVNQETEVQNPPMEVQEPPMEVQKPPMEVQKPPMEVQEPPMEVQEPPMEVQKPPMEVQETPMEVQKTSTWPDGTILDDPRVRKLGKALQWASLDPQMSRLGEEFKEKGDLKTNFWVEERSVHPYTEHAEAMATCMIGLQMEFYESLAGEFVQALLVKEEIAAATIAERLICLGTYGKLKVHSEACLDKDDRKFFKFMTMDEVLSPVGFVWALLCNAIGVKDSGSLLTLELLEKFWGEFRKNTLPVKVAIFRAIVVFCRTSRDLEEDAPRLENGSGFDCGNIKKNVSETLGVLNVRTNLEELEQKFYKKCMTNFHVSKGNASRSDVEEITGKPWEEGILEKLRAEEDEIPQPSKRKAESTKDSAAKKPRAKRNDFSEMPMTINGKTIRLNSGATGKPIYLAEDKKSTFVGPYASVKKIQEVYKLLEALDLETKYNIRILKPLAYYKHDSKFYIQYPLLASTGSDQWQLKEIVTKKGDTFQMYDARSMGVYRCSEYLEKSEDLDKVFVSLYMTLFWFYVLHVGDRSLDNALLVNGQLWFVDLDERKENPFVEKSKGHSFVLSKSVPRTLKKTWEAAFNRHSQDIVSGIESAKEALGVHDVDEIGTEHFVSAKTPVFVAADKAKLNREFIYKPFVEALYQWFTDHGEQ